MTIATEFEIESLIYELMGKVIELQEAQKEGKEKIFIELSRHTFNDFLDENFKKPYHVIIK